MWYSTNLLAQSFGGFLGLNNSKLSGDAPYSAKYKGLTGLNIGAFVDIKLSKGLFLSFQPSFSQEGTKISYKVPGVKEPVDSIQIRLNYFSIPTLLKVTGTNQRFYAIGGLEYGILLNSSMISQDNKEDLDVKVSNWNLAMHFGAGFLFPIGRSNLFVELRYSQGLRNLTDEPVDSSVIPRVKTSGFKVLAGIDIPFKNSKN